MDSGASTSISGTSTPDRGEVRLTLPARPEFVGVARLTMAGVASRLGYDVEGAEDIKLAVAEAMTLLLRETPAGEPVELLARWSDEALDIDLNAARGAASGGAGDEEEAAIAVMVMEEVMDAASVDGLGQAAGPLAVKLRKARAAA